MQATRSSRFPSLSPLPGLALALSLGGSFVSAQEDIPPPVADMIERVDVVLVNVEVWVTDRAGEPIHGLGVDDFEVREDGKPMEITHLSEIRSAAAGQEANAEPTGVARPNDIAPSAAQAVADPPHLVVYFDQMHLRQSGASRVADDLKRFLAGGSVPATRVAILAQDENLAMLADFGSTQEELEAAIERIAQEAPAGGLLDARLALSRMQDNWEIARMTPNPCRTMVNLAKGEIRSRVADLRRQFSITLDNLNATARFLAGLPGLKMLVLVSDSLEVDPGIDLLRYARNVCPREREFDELSLLGDSTDLRRALLDFTSHANTNRVTFYPLQASGLTVSSVFGADNRTFDQASSRGLDLAVRQVQRGGLQSLAVETGGVATFDRNRFVEPLESVARDMGSYYSIAYAPPDSGTGVSHSIDVRVDVPRARVRHRLGYRDKTRDQLRDERLDGAIAFGVMDNPLEVRLAVGELERGKKELLKLPLHLLVPNDGLAFLPVDDRRIAQVEVVVRAREAETGELVERTETRTVSRPDEQVEVSALTVDLELPQGVWVLGVAVRDLATGVSSVVSTTFALQDPETR